MLMEGSHWLNNSRSSQPQTPSAETEAETANASNESESTKAQGKEENMILMQASFLDVRKKTQGGKNSKLKKQTQNSS